MLAKATALCRGSKPHLKETILSAQLVQRMFFAPADARSVNLFRILYCSALAGVHLSQMSRVEHLYSSPVSVYFPIPLFEWCGLVQLPVSAVRACGVVLLLGLLCAASGAFTRVALTVSWISFFFFYGTILGFEKPEPNTLSFYTFHYNNIVFFILLILSVAPGIGVWGLDAVRKRGWAAVSGFWRQATVPSVPLWPLTLIKLTLALAYFGSGFAKLLSGGVYWADGYTLQAYFLMKYLQEGGCSGYWLAQSYWGCVLASLGTLALELTFIVVPFLRSNSRLMWGYVLAGLGFHLMIAATMRIFHFLPFMSLTYLVFLDWPTVCRLVQWVSIRFSPSLGRLSPVALASPVLIPVREEAWFQHGLFPRAFILGTLCVLSASILLRVELWPFSDYGVFRNRSHYTMIQVGQLRGLDKDNRAHWLRPQDFGPGFHGWYDGGSFVRFYLAYTASLREAPPRLSLLLDGTVLRSLVARPTETAERQLPDWRENPEGPMVLRELYQRLPAAVRDQFPILEFVIRSVRRDAEGRLMPTDTVAFSTATP